MILSLAIGSCVVRDNLTVLAYSDTSLQASQVYFERLAAMTPAERVRVGVGLWEAGNALQWATVRRRYPDADEDEIAYRVAILRFGAELARAAYRRA